MFAFLMGQTRARWCVCMVLLLVGWIIPNALLAKPRHCAPDCTCATRRVKCDNPVVINSVKAVIAKMLPPDTLRLDLSGNSISVLVNSSFASFPKLERLNLARNRINIIRSGAFLGLENLKQLNLSHNTLRAIDATAFLSLEKLEKLYLLGNQLSRLANGTFEALSELRNLDIAHNPLICDCQLQWVVNWSTEETVQLSPRTVCQFPPQLSGTRLHKVKHWHCDWPIQIPVFDLRPSESQLVFVGDALRLSCQVSAVEPPGTLGWVLNDQQLDFASDDIVVESGQSEDGMMLQGSLSIPHLGPNHGGRWSCRLNTSSGDRVESVEVKVLSESTHFCPQSVTSGNKGQYEWPRTVEGVVVELPCWSAASASSRKQLSASRVCSELGTWERLDMSRCPYVSEVTKVLEQFAKTNLNITSSSVIESVHRLRNYTADGSVLRDKMDVVFITKTINNYLDFVPKSKEISDALLDIISTVMGLDRHLLKESQLEERACSRLAEAIDRLPELITEGSVTRHHSTLALEEFAVKMDAFRSVTCASFVRRLSAGSSPGKNASGKKFFHCKTGNTTVAPAEDEVLEASIQVPASLFHATELQSVGSHRLQFTIYQDAALFPRTREEKYRFDVLSNVVGIKLAKFSVSNLTEPLLITLRSPSIVGEIVPVWWDFSANDNLGDWSPTGCKLWNVYSNLVSFRCDRLGNFGLLQDVEKVAIATRKKLGGAKFRLFHPIIYLGSTIGVFCLLATIITYILGFKLIHVPKKNKHSLLNTWLAATLLLLTFTLGIRHTESAKICQGTGLLLHYFTLVCLLWMIITASNAYKKLNRSEPQEIQDEIPPDYPLPPKPMLRFYLVGWGIPVIVCGISGAVNMEDYAGYDYCFLAFTHSVGAFYGPCVALVLLVCIFYLLIHCAIRKLDDEASKESKRTTQDGTEIELVEMAAEHASVRSAKAASDDSNEEDDLEHSPTAQLRAQVVTLALFLLCWASAANAAVDPLAAHFIYSEQCAAIAFALMAIALGAFALAFHGAAREDVRLAWRLLSRCRESGIARETEPLPSQAAPSSDSLNSCYTNKSCSTSRSLEGARSRAVMAKVPNVDATVANAGGVTDTSWSGEMFYNPYQNGVARKFFRKHAKQPRCKNDFFYKENLQADAGPPRHHFVNVHNSRQYAASTDKVVKAMVCRDRSTESQLVNSSSQGLTSLTPSQEGNCSEKSLLIVEEEDEEDDAVPDTDGGVDWGPSGHEGVSYEGATFSPSPTGCDSGARNFPKGAAEMPHQDAQLRGTRNATPDGQWRAGCDASAATYLLVSSAPKWRADCEDGTVNESLPSPRDESKKFKLEVVDLCHQEEPAKTANINPGTSDHDTKDSRGSSEAGSISQLSEAGSKDSDTYSDEGATASHIPTSQGPKCGTLPAHASKGPDQDAKVRKRNGPKSETLPRSSWDKQWSAGGSKPKRPVYAFVSRSCHQHMGEDPERGVPRSVSVGDAALSPQLRDEGSLKRGDTTKNPKDQNVKKETAV